MIFKLTEKQKKELQIKYEHYKKQYLHHVDLIQELHENNSKYGMYCAYDNGRMEYSTQEVAALIIIRDDLYKNMKAVSRKLRW